jgi:hypothetical protein
MSSIELTKAQHQEFSKEFLSLYLSRGFGNMSKREMDVLIFHLLQKTKVLDEKSIHLTAMQLRTTPVKVRALIYERALRFPKDDEALNEDYFKQKLREYFVDNAIYKIRKNDEWVYIQIDNPILLDAFKAIAKNNKEVIDSSFSSEIVKISTDGFSIVLNELVDSKTRKEIEKEVKKALKKESIVSFRNIADKALSEIVSQGVQKAPGLIQGFVKAALNGSINDIIQFIS